MGERNLYVGSFPGDWSEPGRFVNADPLDNDFVYPCEKGKSKYRITTRFSIAHGKQLYQRAMEFNPNICRAVSFGQIALSKTIPLPV